MVKNEAPAGAIALSKGRKYGVTKGHIVTKLPSQASLHAYKKPREDNKKKFFAKNLVREIVGLAPYEKRIIDLIKVFGGGADKKIYKMAKKRLGTHKSALKKRDDMKALYSKMRSAK